MQDAIWLESGVRSHCRLSCWIFSFSSFSSQQLLLSLIKLFNSHGSVRDQLAADPYDHRISAMCSLTTFPVLTFDFYCGYGP